MMRDVDAICERTHALLNEGALATARSLVDRALQLDPHGPSTLRTAAWVQAASGNLSQAEQSMRCAIEHDESSADNYIGLHRILRLRGRHLQDPQRGVLRHARALEPHHLGVLEGLADLAVSEGARDQARVWLDELQSHTPLCSEACVTLGRFELSLGRIEHSRVQALQVLRRQPHHLRARMLVREIYERAADHPGLFRVYLEATSPFAWIRTRAFHRP